MNRFFYLFIIFLLAQTLFAQEPNKYDLAPCGAPHGISKWLKDYVQHPEDFPDGADTLLFVKMKMHLLANDNGVGRMTTARLLDAFCRLNADFEEANIRFFFEGDWNEINNSAWHVHGDIPTGIDMMLTNDVNYALNSYMVSDPAGNCGYNLPYASVAVANSCAGPNDHTWAHEIGHNLRLPHPFIGWEGKIYNPNDTAQTPTQVTYDYTYFHDTIDTGPTPLDTALVEFLDGSNCTAAADLFCMTPPDYLAYRWFCDGNAMSTVTQKDPSGETFKSDGTFFMSYADDGCQSRFSEDQIQTMRASLLTEKAYAIGDDPQVGELSAAPVAILPASGTTADPDAIPLVWSSAPNATHYLVQCSRIPSFAFNEFEAIVTDTFATATGLLDKRNYFWRVRPFNKMSTCPIYSSSGSFYTDKAAVSTNDLAENGFKIYPTIAVSGQPIFIFSENENMQLWQVQLLDFSGKSLSNQQIFLQNGQNPLYLPFVPQGLYALRMSDGKRVLSSTVVVR